MITESKELEKILPNRNIVIREGYNLIHFNQIQYYFQNFELKHYSMLRQIIGSLYFTKWPIDIFVMYIDFRAKEINASLKWQDIIEYKIKNIDEVIAKNDISIDIKNTFNKITREEILIYKPIDIFNIKLDNNCVKILTTESLNSWRF